MAQHNMVHLIGIIQTEPTVRVDDETGEVKEVFLYIMTTTATRKYDRSMGEVIPKLVPIRVRATLEDTAPVLARVKPNDVVVLKGVLSTRNVVKQAKCENCGEIFPVNRTTDDQSGEEVAAAGMLTYVTPTAVDVRKTDLTADEALAYLTSIREMSNEVQLMGNLCSDPTPWDGGRITAYQLGVNRKFFQKTDDPTINADYPYIRSYGEQAENDIEALRTSSLVLVDGFLKMRTFMRTSTCPYCGATKDWSDYTMEVVPYSVEYLANYKTGAERQAEKEAMMATQDL